MRLLLLAAAVIVWCFPNTQQILARYKPALQLTPADGKERSVPIYWRPNIAWGVVIGGLFLLGLVHAQNASTFLYFQF